MTAAKSSDSPAALDGKSMMPGGSTHSLDQADKADEAAEGDEDLESTEVWHQGCRKLAVKQPWNDPILAVFLRQDIGSIMGVSGRDHVEIDLTDSLLEQWCVIPFEGDV